MRPYEQLINEASQTGRVLKRTDIYGSGSPVDELSGDAQAIVAEYCFGSVVDFGAGCGALQQYLPASEGETSLWETSLRAALTTPRTRSAR